MKNNILVMLSTYNGEKYLSQQLDSILSQKGVNVDILIRDDGSKDMTKDIILQYASKFDNISYFFGKNVGYAKSFWDLVHKSKKYDYYAFCDQDDIWLDSKLEEAINKINEFSKKAVPILYTSRVVSVNNNMDIISSNTFPCNKVLNVYESFQKSVVPGCTFVFNKYAISLLKKYKGFMESHDWATYAIVKVFGHVIYDNNSYINYRIHSENAIGQTQSKIKKLSVKIKRFFKENKNSRSKFAKDFYNCYKDKIPAELIDEIKCLAFYRERKLLKLKLLFNKNFKGLIFKIYVILNKV